MESCKALMKTVTTLTVALLLAVPAVAMKNQRENFLEPCDVVWKAAVAAAKTQDYRIISISSQDQILSLSVGGAWWGERIVSLSLAPGAERGCDATVQSRYSGLQHSDGPDLLARVHVQIVGAQIGKDSDVFKRYKVCMKGYYSDDRKCYDKLKKTLPAPSAAPPAPTSAKSDPPAKQPNNLPEPVTGDWWKPAAPPAPAQSGAKP